MADQVVTTFDDQRKAKPATPSMEPGLHTPTVATFAAFVAIAGWQAHVRPLDFANLAADHLQTINAGHNLFTPRPFRISRPDGHGSSCFVQAHVLGTAINSGPAPMTARVTPPVTSPATCPAASPVASLKTPLLTNSIFLRRLICYLMPYFAPVTNNMDWAEADILETLSSYGARTRAELLNVVQIIAYSMSGLELLTLAKLDTSLSPPQQIRLGGCANNLNRSAHQAEKTLTARLKCDLPTQPKTPTEPAQTEPVLAGPENDTPHTQTEEILQRIDAQVAAARNAVHPTKRQQGSAIFNALFAEIPPPPPAAP